MHEPCGQRHPPRWARVAFICGQFDRGGSVAVRAAAPPRPPRPLLTLARPRLEHAQIAKRGALAFEPRELLRIDRSTKVVVVTGYGSIATAVEAIRLGAIHYLPKPADADDLLAAFARADQAPLEPTTVEFTAPSLARAEWEHIQRILVDCGGNVSDAARRLGIHRRSLQRKLAKQPARR